MIDTRIAGRIRSAEISMLWRRRLPLGTLSVIAGRPGSGKSTISLLIAAELSKQGLVSVLSNPEDDAEFTIKPRLDALAARQDLIYVVKDSDFVLPKDLDELERMIIETQASLVVLDPVAAHFYPERQIHNREILRRLIAVARRTRSVILGIHHTTKGGGDILERVGGSMGGLVGSSRAVYHFGRDRIAARASYQIEDRWVLKCLKINGIEEPGDLVFDRITVAVEDEIEAPRFYVVGHSFSRSISSINVAAIAEWLTIYLAAGFDAKRLHGEVRTDGQRAGFSWSMLKNVGMDLGFARENGGSCLQWRLPNDHPLRRTQ